MRHERITVELPPYYRTLLDSVRHLIHLLRPDLGPPTQSHCIQFLLGAFPIDKLLVEAILSRDDILKGRVLNEPGEPAIPAIVAPDPGSIWRESIKRLESHPGGKPGSKRRRTGTGRVRQLGA